jgi:hypothetical protein
MNYEYSIYRNEWCGWQLWRGQAGGFRHTQLVRRLLPESVRMMRRRGMLRRVDLSSALQVTMPNVSLERAERSDDTLEDIVRCENCGGSGIISYNPNLNPNSFPGTATAKCTRCGGTGIDDKANK